MPQSLRNNISILTHGQIHLSSLPQMIPATPPLELALLDMTDVLVVQAFLFNPHSPSRSKRCSALWGRGGQNNQTLALRSRAPLASTQQGSRQVPGCQLEGRTMETRPC